MLVVSSAYLALVVPLMPQIHTPVQQAQTVQSHHHAQSLSVFPPSTALLARTASTTPSDFSLSGLLDDVSATSDADAKAAEMVARAKAEEALKANRAAAAIARMDEVAVAKQLAAERAAATGLPTCEESVWGSGSTGLLTAKTCVRVRDGLSIDAKPRTGFGLIF